MHPAFSQIDHRPWPLPPGAWGIAQNWMELAFIHYAVEPEGLKAKLPRGVELETFGGKAWVGLVPFEMADDGIFLNPGEEREPGRAGSTLKTEDPKRGSDPIVVA